MNIRKSYIYIAICICVSCGKKDTFNTEVDPSCHLYPLKETMTISNIENYIDSINLFQIEQNNDAIFSNVKKAIVGKNGDFYILDFNNNLITFNQEGKFCRKVAERGQANNEYINLEDIALSIDGKHLLLLESSNRIIKYPITCSDSTIDRIVLDIIYPIDAIAPDKNNGTYCFATYPSNVDEYKEAYCQLYKVDRKGKVLERNLPCVDFGTTIMNITQSRDNSYLLRPQNSEHIVYRLSQDSLMAAYKINFEEENIPHRYYYNTAGQDMMKYISSPYFKVPLYFYETDYVLYFSAHGRNKQYSYIYSLNKKEGINWIEHDTDMESLQIIASDNMFIYAMVYPTIMENDGMENHGVLYNYIREYIKEKKLAITSDDNPFIAKIRFNI